VPEERDLDAGQLARRYREAGNAAPVRHWCGREDACLQGDHACDGRQDEPNHKKAPGSCTIG